MGIRTISALDKEFSKYGCVIDGLDVKELCDTLDSVSPCPDDRTVYVPDDARLDSLPVFTDLRDRVFGGMPVQIGYCNGYNTKLNCLEYHRGCEINCSSKPFILLLASVFDMEDGVLDTGKVVAVTVPPYTPVRVYETTLHYAPCSAPDPFRVIVVLPKGTNEAKPEIEAKGSEDRLLWAANKWLYAHEESREAGNGAAVALIGKNIDIKEDL